MTLLVLPRCPHCGHSIRWFENMPVISWLLLKGKCSQCHNAISYRYPFVEIITAILSVLVVIKLGVTWQALVGLELTWTLVLTGIDFDTQLLPDRFITAISGIRIIRQMFWFVCQSHSGYFGYVFGLLCLWIVYQLFLLITGKHGMGVWRF